MGKIKVFFCTLLSLLLLAGCGAAPSETTVQTETAVQAADLPHLCSNVCDNCGLCANLDCEDPDCAEKCVCPVCNNLCETCGLCQNPDYVHPDCTEKCACTHVCDHKCVICGACQNPNCFNWTCAQKCPNNHPPINTPFPEGVVTVKAVAQDDFITTEIISLDMGTLVYDIYPDIWVPSHIYETSEAAASAVERITGLRFEGNYPHARSFADGKVHVTTNRDSMYVDENNYQGLASNEFGVAYAGDYHHVVLSPGDLLGHGSSLAHELGHILSYRQTTWTFPRVLSEGFAEYTSYLVAAEVSAADPRLGYYLGNPQEIINNNFIHNYQELYRQPMEYWFENEFQYAGNGNYTVGFRFMAYLQDVYGDYSRWIHAFETAHPFLGQTAPSNGADPQLAIAVLKDTYSEDVLDNFYPWLRAHERDFEVNYNFYRDLSGAEEITLYPAFYAKTSSTILERFQYQDLTIHLDQARIYLSRYKGVDISNARIQASAPVSAEITDDQGSTTSVTLTDPVALEGVRSIRLTGSGMLEYLKIIGYENCG